MKKPIRPTRRFVELYDLEIDRSWMSNDKKWYAGKVKSGQEEKVAERLRKKGINIFIPKMNSDKRAKRRGRPRMTPLFPGYIFMETPMDEYIWFRIIRTEGFIGILGIKNKPVPIPEEEMKPLFEIHGKSKREIFPIPINPGKKLRVVKGPFMGKEGKCKEIKKDTVRVEIEIFRGRKDMVEFKLEDVEEI